MDPRTDWHIYHLIAGGFREGPDFRGSAEVPGVFPGQMDGRPPSPRTLGVIARCLAPDHVPVMPELYSEDGVRVDLGSGPKPGTDAALTGRVTGGGCPVGDEPYQRLEPGLRSDREAQRTRAG